MQTIPQIVSDSQSCEALIDLLQSEEAIFREMRLLLDEEREAMLRLAADRLGELASRKETLGLRVKALDESRRVLARRLGAQYGLAADQVTVSNLCKCAPRAVADRLGAAGRRLREIISECQDKNTLNARAAARGLDLVTGAIECLISQSDPSGKVYQPSRRGSGSYATMSRTSGSGLISRQA